MRPSRPAPTGRRVGRRGPAGSRGAGAGAGGGAGAGARMAWVEGEAGSAELRACASLRAQSFAVYPEGRGQFTREAHLRMLSRLEWELLEAKLAGEDADSAHLRVRALLAALPAAELDADAGDREAAPDRSCQLVGSSSGPEHVVGSLDLNIGAWLPSEPLRGARPEASAELGRAYLSNVCVAPGARRRGVAAGMISCAADRARGEGVSDLYVHVVADNTPALELYLRCGFQVESEESKNLAATTRGGRGDKHARRLLLHQTLL